MAAENNGASAGICDQSELVQYTVGDKAHKVSRSANAILDTKKTEFGVHVGFQDSFGTKHLYPGSVHGSAPRLLPLPEKRRHCGSRWKDGATLMSRVFPRENSQRHTGTRPEALPAAGHFLFAVAMTTR